MRKCGVCGEMASGRESVTEKVETYDDSPPGIGEPLTQVPMYRTAVPGKTTTTWFPCGHRLVD